MMLSILVRLLAFVLPVAFEVSAEACSAGGALGPFGVFLGFPTKVFFSAGGALGRFGVFLGLPAKVFLAV
jgi:hypothetical protein